MAGVFVRALQRFLYSAGDLDVVVLDEDGVVQAETVVRAAADADGVLVEEAQARRGLARVDELRAVRRGDGRELVRARRDARHVLQKVQREALARQHGARRAVDGRDDRARRELHAVFEARVEKDARL